MIQFIHSQDILLYKLTTQTNSFSVDQSYKDLPEVSTSFPVQWSAQSATFQTSMTSWRKSEPPRWKQWDVPSLPAGSSEIFLLLLPFNSQCGGYLECIKHCTVQITCAMQCRTEVSHLVVGVELLPDLHPVCELLGQGHLHGCVNHQVLKQMWTAYCT